MKRYIITADFYIWAKNDEEALKKADKWRKKQITKYDNQCAVVLFFAPFGSLDIKEIQWKKK